MGVLRVLLAIAVVIVHGGGHLFGLATLRGDTAVQAFFVISGFYMALVLTTKYGPTLSGALLFWQNRYLRLAPTYWVVLAVSVALLLWRDRYGIVMQELPHLSGRSLALVVFANLFVVGQDLLNFLGFNPPGEHSLHWVAQMWGGSQFPGWYFLLVPPAWSVALELMFYAVVPLLVRLRSVSMGLLMLASLGLRLFIYSRGFHYDPWTYRFFPTELACFLAGMMAYRLHAAAPWRSVSPRLKQVICLILLGMVILGGWEPCGWAFLLVLPLVLPFVFDLTRHSEWDRRIGELSYPLYLSHWMMKRVGHHCGQWEPVVITVLALLASLLLVHFVERPIDRYRQRRLVKRAPLPLEAATSPAAE